MPDGWETLANGAETSRDARDGRVRLTFAETQPLSTYLFAFAAGRFSVERAARGGREMQFHRETDAAKVARNRDAIFDLHAAALNWLEQYTELPYPFGKFDFLLVPGRFSSAGWNIRRDLLQRVRSDARRVRDAEPAARARQRHLAQTAHMWLGIW